jgi:hypothetical protein
MESVRQGYKVRLRAQCAAGAKGREVSAREAGELLAGLGARRRDAQAAELMGEAREDALAAKAAGPAIERARRGNEGSRLMLGSLSGGDADGSSSTQ